MEENIKRMVTHMSQEIGEKVKAALQDPEVAKNYVKKNAKTQLNNTTAKRTQNEN